MGGEKSEEVWMEIQVGDFEEYERALEEFERGKKFLLEYGESIGLEKSADRLLDAQIEMFEELYSTYAINMAPARCVKPKELVRFRLEICLMKDKCPKAVENFISLCKGDKSRKGTGNQSVKLHYKGTMFHRVEEALIQGGDITRGDGSGGESIFGGKFNDEKSALKVKHDEAGIVGMANSGKNSNTSQFYITFKALPQLDGKHVVIGKVQQHSMDHLIRMLLNLNSEKVKARISDCGTL
uniref:Peptidyl-prolyl cis-trans isomerase n=1 Tax=Timspurckia oligopyrenoides TaxID=708627 RepID=A0A7S0ZDX6_9RHOD|mmetsp:Transcript_1534/g.2752  ORF Transcript_1534/g.2752 Transcript_1534/m.2752 type:complete len:240 (+) Transcript_1534:25-744(+)